MSLILAVAKQGTTDSMAVECGDGDLMRGEALRAAVRQKLRYFTDVTVYAVQPITRELNRTTGYMVLVCCDGDPASIIYTVGGIIDAFRAGHQPN